MAPVIDVKALSKAYGPSVLFDDISFTIDEGERVGLIGPNGCGKTTLFRILDGDEPADDGDIAVQKGATVAYLPQEPAFSSDQTPRSVVKNAVGGLATAIDRYAEVSEAMGSASSAERTALIEEQAELQETIDRLGGWTWQHRVDDVLHRLGIVEADMDRPMTELSGGQRRRVALARVLLQRPNLLLLDEPTNHLDAETIEWLETELLEWSGALLLVTHDRYFLENVVTRILEFDPEGMYSSPGSYSVFMERKLERMRMREKHEEKRAMLAKQELEWLRRGPKARTTKQKARIGRAEDLQEAKHEIDIDKLKIAFAADHRLGGIILECAGVTKSFGEKEVLTGVDLRMRKGEKLAVLGPNGCGKSTLIKVLLGELEPDGGEIRWGKNTRIAYLSQTREGLDPDVSVLESLGDVERIQLGDRSLNRRTYLREFLFGYEDQAKKISALSGGERCRLLLAKLIAENANFVILDEPTNDLDIDSLRVLEEALAAFSGCVFLVTHDRYFINRVCTSILAWEEDAFQRWEGDYDFYKQGRDARDKARKDAEKAARQAAREKADKAAAAPTAKKKKLSWKEERELEGIEGVILEAEAAHEAIETALADPELYRTRADEVAALSEKLAAAEAEVERLYARWAELQERAE